MKILMKIFLTTALVIFSVACYSQLEGHAPSSNLVDRVVDVKKCIWDDAKSSYVSGEGLLLSGSEFMTVFYNQFDASADNQFSSSKVYKAGVAEPIGSDKYSFAHTPIHGAEKYNYYFLSPHHITTSSSQQFRLFSLQFPGIDTHDPQYDLLVGRPIIGSGISDKSEVSGFKRLTAPVKVLLKDPENILKGEDLQALTLSFDNIDRGVVGYISPALGQSYDDVKIAYYSQSTMGQAVTALFPEGLSASGNEYPVWLSVLPISLNAGQKLSFTAEGRSVRAYGMMTLETSGELSSEKLNLITLILSASADKTETLFQDFSTCKSIDNIPFASDGKKYGWNFSSGSVYKTEGKYGMHGGVILKTNSSSLTIPDIDGKVIKSMRVYSHEETYSSSSVGCELQLKSEGKLIASKSINPYGGDIRNGGFVEFNDIALKKNLVISAVSTDGSTSHIVPISAISLELADAEEYVKTVECYDYPDNYRTSTIYSAKVDGKDAHVFQTEEPHVLAFGCKDGATTRVEITAVGGINSVIARPKAKGYDCVLSEGKVILNLKPYDRVVVEINGDTSSPLFVFANPIDESVPSANDPKVIYVPAGTIRTEDVILDSGQTLYIAGGGVLTGRVYAKNKKDITVRGYGVIDGIEDSPDSNRPVYFEYTDDIIMNDCIVLNRTSWTVNMFECNDIIMDNCKIIATKNPAVTNGHQNDGFSIIGSDRMKV